MTRTLLRAMAAGLLLLETAATPGCGSSLHEAGIGCSSDGECSAGLSCLGLATSSDAGCFTLASTCSKTCRTDADCASVGASFKCFANCSGTGTCGRSQ
jgi:hypothetical protein